VALINWYGAPSPVNGPGRPVSLVSRGVAVPSLLAAASFAEAREAADALPRHDMLPFRLLVFSLHERIAREFRWDRNTLGEQTHAWEPSHWFSSGFDEPRAQFKRSQVASDAAREGDAGSLPWLRRLRASHQPARGPICFCMHRADAATVNYTEIVVSRRSAAMRYHDGALCCIPRPTTTHRILLPTARKEFATTTTNPEPGPHLGNLRFPLHPSRRPPLPRSLSPRRKVRALAH